MHRTQPITIKISLITHVQLLQWLHGKQQQHVNYKTGNFNNNKYYYQRAGENVKKTLWSWASEQENYL